MRSTSPQEYSKPRLLNNHKTKRHIARASPSSILENYLYRESNDERNIYIDRETHLIREITEIPSGAFQVLNISGKKIGDYTIKPVLLVKNFQSKFRDLSIIGFLNDENREQILEYLSQNRFYTVIYNITKEMVVEDTKSQENDSEAEKVHVECVAPEKPSYLSVLKQTPVISDTASDEGSTDRSMSSMETTSSRQSFREYENVRNYYHKYGDHRMYVLFQNTVNYGDNKAHYMFSQEDKFTIRRLLNRMVVSNHNIQKLIRDNDYYYIKVVKTFHKNVNRKDKSLHFNIVFKNKYTASNVFHIYTDVYKENILSITRTENMI